MLVELAVWYLKKRKKSVLINYHFSNGNMRQLEKCAYVYNCHFEDVQVQAYDGTPIHIPEGSFYYEKALSDGSESRWK